MKSKSNLISRRTFIHRTALAAAAVGSVPSLKALGYKSPNEKLNLAAIGAGGQPFSDLRNAHAGVENVVALTDVDWSRGAGGFAAFPKAAKYKDFRQMLDKSGKDIDAVIIGTADHMHAWTGRPSWPQGMTKIPPPTPVPETLDWDLWLGGAAWRPFTAGDDEYRTFVAERNSRGGRGGGRGRGGEGPGGATNASGAAATGRGGRGGGGFGGGGFGFYLPFNWRGFFDFGSSLIGDWGVHILGPANWALQLSPETLISVECIKKDSSPPFTFPDELAIQYEFAARGSMPPVAVYWHHHAGGDAYLPTGMTADEARKISDTGPQVGPSGRGGFGGGQGGVPGGNAPAVGGTNAPNAAGAPGGHGGPAGARGSGYNCIFAGSKGYLGTNGRGEGVGLLPGSRWAEYKLPTPYLTRSPGASTGDNHSAHCRDWVRACKGGAAACSNFSIAGKYTEWLLLGSVAVHYEGKLLWDAAKGEITNIKDANQWVKPTFRKGWELVL